MEDRELSTELKSKVANPGPLGLLGFGMTTVLLNLHNAGLLPLSIVIVAMGQILNAEFGKTILPLG